MEYAIYFEADGETYRLPVNPEEITRTSSMDTEQYRMLTGNQIVIPVGKTLEEFSFEAEFPHSECNYTNKGFRSSDVWEKLLLGWQQSKKVIRFIASNGLGDDISIEVLLTKSQHIEKAGEEGDKYISVSLLEYIAPSKRYVAVASMKRQQSVVSNPAVTAGKTHTVEKGDTLWALAKKYYGDGSRYNEIFQANSGQIKNPNLIYPGQVFSIPG